MRVYLTTILAAALLSFSIRARAELVDGIMAIVYDSVITTQQIDLVSRQDELMLREKYRFQPEIYQKEMEGLQNSIYTNLVERQLVLSYFKTITNKVNETIIDQIVMDEIHENQHYRDRVQLTKELQRKGLTFEDFRQQIRDDLIIRELIHENVPEPIISPQKIEKYYQAHNAAYKLDDQVKMRMIVLNKGAAPDEVRKRGEEILLQLKGGASFAEMASVNSEGSQRREGGETGWEDTSDVSPVLVQGAEQMKPGECSGVIETTDAFFILLLEDRHATHIKPLSEVRNEVENTLKSMESERLRKKWIERLRAKTYIGYL